MNKKSVWITGYTLKSATQPIFDYLNEQAKDLSEQTDGKVKAELVTSINMEEALSRSMSRLAAQLGRSTPHSSAKDASELYEMTPYDFYLFDRKHNYEFILFRIKCNDMFPVQLTIDQTVAKEIGRSDSLQVDTYEAFTRLFERVVQSNKVVYIIQKLLNMDSITDTEEMPDIKDIEDDTIGNDETKNH